eukprot:TRINITY_DN6947_c0_g1_i1.p1 TRINITY_DN6947_c0_g1~~TRINITY_DN6947_c0_g1_i1.p1  ORF type:complete len:536 (+),score=138.66 TRINITY_DN6947_c0_g1_i1:175-1608(+)
MRRKSFSLEIPEEAQVNGNLDELRRQIKDRRRKTLLGERPKWKKGSLIAFRMGVDKAYTEDEIDNIVLNMMDPEHGIKGIGHQKVSGKHYESCFSGLDATNWIVENMGLQRAEAVQKGQTAFMNRSIFVSISKSHVSFHDKSDVFYQMKSMEPQQPLEILNDTKRILEESNPNQISERICRVAMKLMRKNVPLGETSEFSYIKGIRLYRKFLLLVSRLQKIKIEDKWSNDEKIRFLINVYNSMKYHIKISSEVVNEGEWVELSSHKKYLINTTPFSLNDILFILRGKREQLSEVVKKMEWTDIQCPHPFFHFCLFDATAGSPAIREMKNPTSNSSEDSNKDLNEQIKDQTKEFLMQVVEVNEKRILLPYQFLSFNSDFLERFKDPKKIGEEVGNLLEEPLKFEYLKVFTQEGTIHYAGKLSFDTHSCFNSSNPHFNGPKSPKLRESTSSITMSTGLKETLKKFVRSKSISSKDDVLK